MKKGKKILLALLSATFLASGAIGFSACKKNADRDPAIVAIYEQYVAYAEANGDTVQSYDDWLAGVKGDKGDKGDDGLTPSIGQNGNWFLGTTDTGVPATGPQGATGAPGSDGATPQIGANGNWWIGGTDTNIPATGQQGATGASGSDGITPNIGANGNWWIGETDTGVPATGNQGGSGETGGSGEAGLTPYIGTNGNWWIGETDTGVSAAGVQGPQGPQGEQGDNGVSIESVKLNDDGTALIITYSNKTKQTIPLPPDMHTHAYDGEIQVVIMPTATSEGLAYKTCILEGCEHKELVAIKQIAYVTVKDVDGDLISGATVTINGQKATTNANGVATVLDFGSDNEYAITATKSGYVQTKNVSTTAEGSNFEIELIKSISKSSATIRGTGTYQVAVDIASKADAAKLSIRVSAGAKALSYTIDLGEALATVGLPGVNGSSSLTVNVGANASKQVDFVVDGLNLPADFTFPGTYIFNADVTVEESTEGSEVNPLTLTSGTEATYTAEANEWVYFRLNNPDYAFNGGSVTFGNNVSVEYVGGYVYNYEISDYKPMDSSFVITSGEEFSVDNDYCQYYLFRAKATDGNIAFTVKHKAGTKYNPLALEIGKDYNLEEISKVYVKYTATETGKVVIVSNSVWNYTAASEWWGPASFNWGGTYIQTDDDSFYNYYFIDATAGETYEFTVQSYYPDGSVKCVFSLEKYDENKVYASKTLPVDLSGKETFNQSNGVGATYYTYTATADGRLKIGFKDAEGYISVKNLIASIYSDDSYISYSQVSSTYIDKGHWDDWNYVDEFELQDYASVLLKKGETVYISLISNPTDVEALSQYTVGIDFYEFAAVENTIVVKDSAGKAVAGVEVSVAGETGTTDANGEVKLTFVPGVHRIYVAYDEESYSLYGNPMTTLPTDGSFDKGGMFNVTLDARMTKVFTVKSGNTPLAGITVKLMRNGLVVATGRTGDAGTVSLSFYPGEYTIALEGLDEDNYAYTEMTLSRDQEGESIDIEVTAKVTYVVTVTVPSGSELSAAGLTVNLVSGNKVVATGTTDANGVAEMDTKLAPGTYTVQVEDLPEGMLVIGSATADSTAVDASIFNISAVVKGGTSRNNAVAIGKGAIMITNTGYVKFTASVADTYTFTISSGYFNIVYVNSSMNTVSNGSYIGGYNPNLQMNLPELDSYTTNASGLVNGFTHKLDANGYIILTPSEANAVVTITGTIPDEEPPVEGELRTGENAISVTAAEAWSGKEYFFIAKEAGKYTVTVTSANAYAWVENMGKPVLDGAHGVMSYEFNATAGQTVYFYFGAVAHDTAAQYTATIAKDGDLPGGGDQPGGGDEPAPQPVGNTLSVGETTVNAASGVTYTFTSTTGGTYTISIPAGANAYIYTDDVNKPVLNGDENNEKLSNILTLTAGQTVTFHMETVSGEGTASYVVTIAEGEESQTPVTELSVGDNPVAASGDGNTLTFTAEVAGTYTLTCTDSNAAIVIEDSENGAQDITSPYEFELAAGESIEFKFYTQDWQDDTYIVTITNNNAR